MLTTALVLSTALFQNEDNDLPVIKTLKFEYSDF